MAIKLPKRNYFTFFELTKRWDCTESDLRHAVITGKIKPSIRLKGDHCSLNWELDACGEWVHDVWFPCEDDDHNRIVHQPRTWLYLQDPFQTGAFDCEFELVSDSYDPVKMEIPFDNWYALPEPITMDGVVQDAVFLLKDIAAFESANGDDSNDGGSEQAVSTKERISLLIIIAVLAKEAKLDRSKTSRTAAQIRAMAQLMGIAIGESTIESHLKRIDNALEARLK